MAIEGIYTVEVRTGRYSYSFGMVAKMMYPYSLGMVVAITVKYTVEIRIGWHSYSFRMVVLQAGGIRICIR